MSEVRILHDDDQPPGRTTCGTCGLSWDNNISTATTPVPSGRCPFEYEHPDGSTVTVTLVIENTYELYDDVTTTYSDVVVPAPPSVDSDEYDDWAYDHIRCFTGVGHEDGDSWYDVKITASSDPALVGRTFDWGY